MAYPNRWKKGQSGNPKGRPRKGNALAEKIRAKVDLDDLVDEVIKLSQESHSETTKMAAINFLAERGWKKPAQVMEVTHTESEFDGVSMEELEARQIKIRGILEAIERAHGGEVVGLSAEGVRVLGDGTGEQ